MQRFINLFIIFFSCNSLYAATLSGVVSDSKSQALPFVNVYINGTTIGTTCNQDGFYRFELSSGRYAISYRLIGYKLETRQVDIANENVTLDIVLNQESVVLKELSVNANREDPAYEIIRKAQGKRKFYRDQVKSFKCQAYVKSTQRLDSYPERFMGQKVDLSTLIDTATNIFYLSESVSELFYLAPDKYREVMTSSKVSGSARSYSFNQASDLTVTFYDNLVSVGNLTPRGIVSPIAANAIFYYRFRLEGSYFENGKMVNKIEVIPKRINDPVFTGQIYITENDWRIYSTDLFITKNQQMEFVDTFRIKQNFVPINDSVSFPFSSQFNYNFGILGFRGSGVVQGVFSNYDLKVKVDSIRFKGEVMRVNDDANKKDSTFWTSTRPIPLTSEEKLDYHWRDSIVTRMESPAYLDSVDKASSKFTFNSIFSGYHWQNTQKRKSLTVKSPLQIIYFNTVEGWRTGISAEYKKEYRDKFKEFEVRPEFRYGINNERLNGHLIFDYTFNTKKKSKIYCDVGSNVFQFNRNNPISELVNSTYSLFARKNYMKIYEKVFFLLGQKSEVYNGFTYDVRAEIAQRKSLSNNSDYSFFDADKRVYLSNDPVNPLTDSLAFSTNTIFQTELKLTYRPGQQYITRPDMKYNLGSKWPLIVGSYIQAFDIAGTDISYNRFTIGVQDKLQLGLMGELSYNIFYGDFLAKNKITFVDYAHFNGNRTWFADFGPRDFRNLEYYKYSTTGSFIESHLEQNFGGFLLNKIPLIRKLKLQEIAGVHYLHTNELKNYAEVCLGVEKLGIFRAELFTSFTDGRRGTIGFVVGFKQIFGRR